MFGARIAARMAVDGGYNLNLNSAGPISAISKRKILATTRSMTVTANKNVYLLLALGISTSTTTSTIINSSSHKNTRAHSTALLHVRCFILIQASHYYFLFRELVLPFFCTIQIRFIQHTILLDLGIRPRFLTQTKPSEIVWPRHIGSLLIGIFQCGVI